MQLSLSCNFLHESAGNRLAAQVSLQFYFELACYGSLEDTYLIADYFLKKILIVVDDNHMYILGSKALSRRKLFAVSRRK